MIKNNQDCQSILILIMVQKNLTENRINFSLDILCNMAEWLHTRHVTTSY